MYKNNIDVRVLVNGRPVKEYSHKGMTLVESRHGTNYTVRVKNDNNFRVMVVVSVDGLDVLTGKRADNAKKGYIVGTWSSLEIKGYRISDVESASFIFTSKGKAYVTKTTQNSSNSGVIGVRAFAEKEREVVVHHHYPIVAPVINPTWPVYYTNTIDYSGRRGGYSDCKQSINYSSSNYSSSQIFEGNSLGVCGTTGNPGYAGVSNTTVQAGSAATAGNTTLKISARSFDSGTGFGKKQVDKVKKEYFEVGNLTSELIFYYASREGLEEMGVDFNDSPKVAEIPSAFGESKYCTPPQGWVGQ